VRILHIAWEYPPLVYGGLGRHVGALATAQAELGHDVVVVTQAQELAVDEVVAGVRVIRVPRDSSELAFTETNLVAWVAGLEGALTRAVVQLSNDWQADIVHGHDWMVAHAAVAAGELFDVALVTTIHATEVGRHQGWLPSELSATIHDTESWLAQQSTRLIACSAHMSWEISTLFDVPEAVITVVPNGIDASVWRTSAETRAAARARFAPQSPLLVFSGRLEWEKGVHTLLDAMVPLGIAVPSLRLAIAGKGGKEADIRTKISALHLAEWVELVGWLPEDELHALVACADVAIVPSLYEPFGLVALEAAALGTPLVVAAAGGLAEFADEGKVALTFSPGDPVELALAVQHVLNDPAAAQQRSDAATQALTARYSWPRIADQTSTAYAQAHQDGRRPVTPAPNGDSHWNPASGVAGKNLLYQS